MTRVNRAAPARHDARTISQMCPTGVVSSGVDVAVEPAR
jgi:hypothetical protein